MNRILQFLMQQKMIVTLIVILIFAVGFSALRNTNRESIPNVSFDMVKIMTIYAGASPNDAEELISIPIEKKLRQVDGIDKVRSYNIENVSVVVVYIDDKAKDKKKVVQDIKDAVDLVDNLPSSAEKPVVEEITVDNTEIISVAFTGKDSTVTYDTLRKFAKDAEDFFYDIDGIAKMDKWGYYDREYLVEVNQAALDRNRIGMNTLINKLKMRNVDLPGGSIKYGKNEFVLRTTGKFKNADEIRNTVIMGNDSGFATRIGDVAKVTDTYEDADVYHRFGGKEAIIFRLYKKRSADEIALANKIREEVKKLDLPQNKQIEITLFNDRSVNTKSRLESVIHEAILGAIFLALLMFLLLGKRMAAIVIGSIPITFMITFVVMQYMGITLNVISMFGMIMVLGMVVDFAIVISENSHRYMEHGYERGEAIRKGVLEVFAPVTTTLICIIIAFVPLLLVTGIIGKFIHAIPIVIITALIASWFIAMYILPTYLNIFLDASHEPKEKKSTLPERIALRLASLFGSKKIAPAPLAKSAPSRARTTKKIPAKTNPQCEDENFECGLFGRIQSKYKKLVFFAVSHRYITVGLLFAVLVVSLFFVAPKVGFRFMPGGGEEAMKIKVKFNNETNLDANLNEIKKIEQIVLTTPSEELRAVHSFIGEESSTIIDPKPGQATYKTTVEIFLCPEKERNRIADVICTELREKIKAAQKAGKITDKMDIKVELTAGGPPVGKPVNVEIRGKDYEVMKKISKEYMAYLKTIDGIKDLSFDLEEGKQEYRYTVDEAIVARTGVSAYDMALALNASFAGSIATKVNQNEEEVGVRVRFPEKDRNRPNALHDVKVSNNAGGLIPLDKVSKLDIEPGYSQINRLNYKRLVQVQADVDQSKIVPNKVNALLAEKFADIEKRYPGYLIKYGGEQEDSNKSMGELGIYFVFALFIMYVVLTIFTRSLTLPMVIMIAIPFALVGVILALYFHHQPMSFMSTLGLFSLAGIIVSNTLVLVQFINQFRDEGLSLKDAIVEGGVVRLRPIILTAGAMILELMPVIYGVGGKDYFVSPLALAFGYGLMFATFITLILIPCFYHIAEDMLTLTSRVLKKFGITMDPRLHQNA